MVNRDNWKLTRQYLAYLDNFKQRDPATIAREKSSLTHLLQWADSKPIQKANELEPIYPRYLSGLGLGPSTVARNCIVARNFFRWLRLKHPRFTSKLDDMFLETLQFSKRITVGSHNAYTLEEIRKLVATPAASLTDTRMRAAVALLFVSGMRVGAFVTMPIDCINLDKREVRQWPELGVEVKGDKRATTYLLNLPDLFEVIQQWDNVVRPQLPLTAMWYAPLTTDGMALLHSAPGRYRTNRLRDGLAGLCALADVRYRNPHQIRHGHAAYAMALCQDLADYKAVSLNMLHADLTVTDRVYSEMSGADIRRRIEGLGK